MTGKGQRQTRRRIVWEPVIARAAEIVEDSSRPLSLRQVFYVLVSEALIPNSEYTYTNLSRLTADLRRSGQFPALADGTRGIEVPGYFFGSADARRYLRSVYRQDRTEGQPYTVVIAAEKRGLGPMLTAEFGRPYGLPVVALGGYASESLEAEVNRYIAQYDRPAVLLYAGDHDPSGADIPGSIPSKFVEHTGPWHAVVRVAVTPEQIVEYGLIENPGKETDSRAAAFRERYGDLVQVEVDAIPADTLAAVYRAAFEQFHDPDALADVLAAEALERAEL